MLFGEPGADRPLTVVDWQTVTWGPAMTDVAYFLGCALPDDVRRDNYDALLAHTTKRWGRMPHSSLDDVREGVRRQSFFGVMMAIVSSMLVERTERGDEMFMVMLRRHSQHVLDTDALATLPEPAAPRSVAAIRGRRGRTPTRCGAAVERELVRRLRRRAAGHRRLVPAGLDPQSTHRVGQRAAVRARHAHRRRERLRGAATRRSRRRAHRCHRPDPAATEPLRTYRVRLRGRGQAYDDPSALLRGEPGRPVELSMDLVWTTVGTPYQYRLTPRYEIPCTVSGTVEPPTAATFAFEGRAGAARPLLGSAGLVEHGLGVERSASARRHASSRVDLRIPGSPPIGVGYIQPPDGSLVELQAVSARETFGDNGLPVDNRRWR